ncbi:hypothetical protein SAMN02910340_01353 [Methanosarcina thermophila]|uniref:Uncharacterized protein n=1 Tax=Methanosarcina thermophila TaxID=2210 RepID=A0A1I6Z7P1_METTE|nr:hypothetical protein SAMN02910340_01353 [Methanosarcina thermophila]
MRESKDKGVVKYQQKLKSIFTSVYKAIRVNRFLKPHALTVVAGDWLSHKNT